MKKSIPQDYDDPYNCLETFTGILSVNGTWIIIKKPMFWVWKVHIEYRHAETNAREVKSEEFCDFSQAVAMVRAEIKKQESV